MSINADIQSLSPSSTVELFVLDLTKQGGGVEYFHAGTNNLLVSVTWQGNIYSALPIEAEGFAATTKGALPRPRIRIANVGGMFSQQVAQYSDLVGCTVIRKRTFVQYLDAVNFASGNANADPNQHLPDDIWLVERKMTETRYMVEWELSSAYDLMGMTLPGRQVVQNTCQWAYRSSECGYTGTNYFDANDAVTLLQSNDYCAKRLSSCKLRFPAPASMPYGGFPGSVQY